MNSLSFVAVASPPPAPQTAAVLSYAASTMNQVSHLLATFVQDAVADYQMFGQVISQEVASIEQFVGHFFGITPTISNQATTPQPSNSSDIGVGRGNGSGAGSGSGATATANNNPTPSPNNSTIQSGGGSGSGSNATTSTHANAPRQGSMKVQPLTSGTGSSGSGSLYSGSGSGTGSVGSGSGSGQAVVSGNVWQDSNGDGYINNGEQGYSDITVELVVAATQNAVVSAKTDGGGNFRLTAQTSFIPTEYQVLVVFSSAPYPGIEATIPLKNGNTLASSLIGPHGFTAPFELANGGWRDIEAGVRSMNVNTTQDDANGALGNDLVTLRDAMNTGNNNGGKMVTFSKGEQGGNVSGTISLEAALPPINVNYNIDGPGAYTLAVDGNNSYRVFGVNATSTIIGLTIEDGSAQNDNGGGIFNKGNLTLSGDIVAFNDATGNGLPGGDGGGIYNAAGAQVLLDDVWVFNNTAGASGGGVMNSGLLTISNGSVFETNNASLGGGGICNAPVGKVIATDGTTQIHDNTDSYYGGGVNNAGKFTMDGGSINDNNDQAGGGVLNGGTMTLLGVSIEGNQASTKGGGGIYAYSGKLTLTQTDTIGFDLAGKPNKAPLGGGLFVAGGTANVSAAIENNSASNSGGGIYVSGGNLTLNGAAVNGNTASLSGGGVYIIKGAIVKVVGGSIAGNKAVGGSGGGIYINTAHLSLRSASISDNNAASGGGGLYVAGGTVTASGGTIRSNQALGAGNGGGIYLNSGTLTLKHKAAIGGIADGEQNTAANGGGFYIAGGTAILSSATVEGNLGTNVGGGIYVNAGKLTLNDAFIGGNRASMCGGLFVDDATVKVTSGLIVANLSQGGSGGGIYVWSGSLTMKGDYAVSDNQAPNGNGGGMIIREGKVTLSGGSVSDTNVAGLSGGGIYNSQGTLTIQNGVHIIQNGAQNEGGGMYLQIGSTTTFVGNAAAGNTACTIKDNTIGGGLAATSRGLGVYQQVNPPNQAIINNWAAVIDKDDPGGGKQPVQGP